MGPTSLFDKGCPTTSFDELVVVDARAAKAPRKEARTELSFHDNVGCASEKQVNLFFARLARHFSYGVSALLGTKARAYRSKNSQIHKKFGKNVKRSRKRKTFLVFYKISQKNRRNRCICERKYFTLQHDVDPGKDLYFVLWQSRLKKPLSFMTVTRSVWRWWLTMWFL